MDTDTGAAAEVLKLSCRDAVDDCWNRIGVRGDRSCSRLREHIHCRNCPVHAEAARALLDRPLPAGYLATAAEQLAPPASPIESGRRSVLIFRVASEWLALPSRVLREIAATRTLHSIPHRRNGTVLGLVNIRGELLICASLAQLLGLTAPAAPASPLRRRAVAARLLVLEHEGRCAVCPVDEVEGLHSFHPRELLEAPASLRAARASHVQAVLPWMSRNVGLLDEASLLAVFERSFSLASAT
jgi:chemotaxis-related protein WspD